MKTLYKISLTLDEIKWVREVLGRESDHYDTYKKFSDAETEAHKIEADLTRYKA